MYRHIHTSVVTLSLSLIFYSLSMQSSAVHLTRLPQLILVAVILPAFYCLTLPCLYSTLSSIYYIQLYLISHIFYQCIVSFEMFVTSYGEQGDILIVLLYQTYARTEQSVQDGTSTMYPLCSNCLSVLQWPT